MRVSARHNSMLDDAGCRRMGLDQLTVHSTDRVWGCIYSDHAHDVLFLGSPRHIVHRRIGPTAACGCIYWDHAVHLAIWPSVGRVPAGAEWT